MNRLSIKWKMGLIALLAGLGFAILITYNYTATSTLDKLNDISRLSVQLEAEMLMLRRHEKDFIARKDLKYLTKFEKSYNQIKRTLAQAESQLQTVALPNKYTDELKIVLNSYQEKFHDLVQEQQTIGLHAKDGLYGSLRKEVHQIENLLTQSEQSDDSKIDVNSLMRTMLMLRRHEKDFMLRRDSKYVDKFSHRITIMRDKINAIDTNSNFTQQANIALNNYQQQFMALVAGEQAFGLTSSQGVLGEMRKSIHQSETILNSFNQLSKEHIEQYIARKSSTNLLVGASVVLVILVTLALIANGISRRITALSKRMTYAASAKDLSLRATLSGNDEITAMAKTYNHMMAQFDSLMTEVRQSSLELAQASIDLKHTSEQAAVGVNRQLSDSEQLVSAMTQVSDSVSEVAFNAGEAAKASSTADQASSGGHQMVTENRMSFEKLVADIETSGTIIQNLSTESNNIEAMLNDIRGIADQTNLLALNAAIEAARAGEQGRGFAVVADEVRTLAQRSAESTLEIENVISRLQSLASEAVSAMQLGRTQAETSVVNTNNVEIALNDIKVSSEAVNSMNRQIATAAQQQSTVVQEINLNLMSIADVAKNTSHLSETISVSSEQLQHLSDQLGKRVMEFKLTG